MNMMLLLLISLLLVERSNSFSPLYFDSRSTSRIASLEQFPTMYTKILTSRGGGRGIFRDVRTKMTRENTEETVFSAYNILKKRNPFDVHVYYNSKEEAKEAMSLRERMQEAFPWMRFYNPKGYPIGPHPVPMWEADFAHYDNRYKLDDVVQFLQEERRVNNNNLSILIHPHTTDSDYMDHTEHAVWIGDPLPLRMRRR